MKKEVIILLMIIILSFSLVSAGWWGSITGKAIEDFECSVDATNCTGLDYFWQKKIIRLSGVPWGGAPLCQPKTGRLVLSVLGFHRRFDNSNVEGIVVGSAVG